MPMLKKKGEDVTFDFFFSFKIDDSSALKQIKK